MATAAKVSNASDLNRRLTVSQKSKKQDRRAPDFDFDIP
jgi:hypothetical protein